MPVQRMVRRPTHCGLLWQKSDPELLLYRNEPMAAELAGGIMSLEQLSSLAQIVSALLIVPSLIFVGFQLKVAAAAVRVAASQAHSERYTDLAKSVVDSADFARIWSDGLADPKHLKAHEWVRFVAYANALFRSYESSRVQWLNGRLDEEHWRTVEHQVADFWQMPGLQAAWEARGHGFSPIFAIGSIIICRRAGRFLTSAARRVPVGRSFEKTLAWCPKCSRSSAPEPDPSVPFGTGDSAKRRFRAVLERRCRHRRVHPGSSLVAAVVGVAASC